MAYKHKDCVNSWIVSKKKHPRYVQLMKSLQLLFWLFQEAKYVDFINVVYGEDADSYETAFCRIKEYYKQYPKFKKRKLPRINGDCNMYDIPPSQL